MGTEHEPSYVEYLRQLEELLGPEAYQQTLRETYADALRQAVSTSDTAAASDLYAACGHDLTIVPSTPAWTGFASWYEGRLAVVADHVLFFATTIRAPGCRVLFDMAGPAVEVTFSRKMGSISMTLRDGSTKKKVFLTPPRHSSLTEVSAPAEGPGFSAVVDQVKGLFDAAGALGEAAGLLGESVSMFRSHRIAKVHQEMWRVYLDRLKSGESAPFTNRGPEIQSTSMTTQPSETLPPATKRPRVIAEASSVTTAGGTAGRRTMSGDEEADGHLAERVAGASGVSADAAQVVIDMITDKVFEEIEQHGRSRVPALGTFVLCERRQPGSSQPTGHVTFRATKGFRDAVEMQSEVASPDVAHS
ncbi:MAG: hypothetical protein M3Y26_03915 [Actinomycetota bacterium]|nr:hypothetical protein [Actinomycetota bacterium]